MQITGVESEREIERLETPSKIIKERRDNRQTRDSLLLLLTSTVASPFVPCNCLQLIPACGQLNMPRLGCVTVAILLCRCAWIDQLGSSHPLDPSSACSALLVVSVYKKQRPQLPFLPALTLFSQPARGSCKPHQIKDIRALCVYIECSTSDTATVEPIQGKLN